MERKGNTQTFAIFPYVRSQKVHNSNSKTDKKITVFIIVVKRDENKENLFKLYDYFNYFVIKHLIIVWSKNA